jgi:hypothetical protein
MTQPANRPSVTTRSNGGSRSAPTWQSRLTGAPVRGGNGEKLGKVDTVYFDNNTDAPAWAAVTTDRFGGYVALVPLAQADWDGDTLSVPFDMQALKAAPHHDPDAAISPDDEDELYRQYGLADERSATDRRRDRTSTPSEQDLPGTQDRVDDRDEPGPPDEQWHGDPDELGGDREPRRESAGVPRTVEQVTDRARPATSTSIAALAPTPDMSKAVTAWFDMAGDLMKLPQQLFASMLGAGNPHARTTTNGAAAYGRNADGVEVLRAPGAAATPEAHRELHPPNRGVSMIANGTTGTYISLHEQRVKLVAAALRQDSDLTADTADIADTPDAMARRALYALDHIPENVR